MSSYAEVELNVIHWAEARGIIQNGKHIGQARKTLEEAGELLEAISAYNALSKVADTFPDVAIRPEFKKQLDEAKAQIRDAAGDTAVTLIVGCAVADIDLVECLYGAFEEIKDRKGFLRPDGVFVKEIKQCA